MKNAIALFAAILFPTIAHAGPLEVIPVPGTVGKAVCENFKVGNNAASAAQIQLEKPIVDKLILELQLGGRYSGTAYRNGICQIIIQRH